jgi:hypothetical protein
MKPIIIDEGAGYRVRGYTLSAKAIKCALMETLIGRSVEFVIIDWEHPNYGYFSDGMFWWKSMHYPEWHPIHLVGWMEKYTKPEELIKDYPEFKDLFKEEEHKDISSPLLRAMKKIAKRPLDKDDKEDSRQDNEKSD